VLVEVNAHSLFSRWFSESGKLVSKLFGKIQELLEDEDSLVFVLVDEVESLAAARKSAANGSEPSDAIRVVNALLTQLDALKCRPNAIVLTTSNITEAIDLAFVDRADIKCYIGPPGMRARYEILRSCVRELIRRDLVQGAEPMEFDDGVAHSCPVSLALREAADACDGLSGRALRKLPFLAYSTVGSAGRCSVEAYLRALVAQSAAEIADRHRLDASTTTAAA
jgi:SpoVK/Ycf46/Vps4 family AAA+-type ATPase